MYNTLVLTNDILYIAIQKRVLYIVDTCTFMY